MGDFPCTSCGACCRRVRAVDPTWPVGPDGRSCIHLKPDNTCAIYETRPLICRVDATKPEAVSVDDWHKVNALMCNKMQEQDGLDAGLRVVTPFTKPPSDGGIGS